MFRKIIPVILIPVLLISAGPVETGKSDSEITLHSRVSSQSIYTQRGVDDYEYFIVTTNALKDSWDDFIAFNTRRAMRTKIETIENINATVTGNGPAEKLRNYIRTEYENHNIVFVMLGGDDNITTANQLRPDAIPHKSYFAEFKDYGTDYIADTDMATDMYYECLDGEGGIEDLEWEVYAGRFPVDDAAELQNIIAKTIAYSENPVASVIQKTIMASEGSWSSVMPGGFEYYIEQVKGDCNKHGYQTKGIPDSWDFNELYETPNSMWTKDDIIKEINGGCNLLNWAGHSNNFLAMKLNCGTDDLDKLQNNAYFIGYLHGSYNGAYDNRIVDYNGSMNTGHYNQDCISEELVVGTPYGSVALICPSRFGGIGMRLINDSTYNNSASIRFHRFFYDALFNMKLHFCALMNAYSKWVNKDEILNTDPNTPPYFGQMDYAAFEMNLLGDPALSIWTETPKTWTNRDWSFDGKAFEMDTKSSFACIALCGENGNILATQITDESGFCKIDDKILENYFSTNPNEKLVVRIKAHNYMPFVSDPVEITTFAKTQSDLMQKIRSHGSHISIDYSVPTKGTVEIALYNAKGSCIKSLLKKEHVAGEYEIRSTNKDLPSGIYYIRFEYNNSKLSKKIAVAK